jgi:ElaB/YqjD/DUF883 family membrane-anchored ribosome-binding protein
MAQSPTQPQSQLEQGWQNLRVDMNKIRSDLAGVAQALFDAGRTEAGEARVRLQEMAQHKLDSVRQALDSARQRGQNATDVIKQQVEEKPLLAVALAFGAGMLLGLLAKRK